MMLRSIASLARASLALLLPVLLAASCGGNVIVEDPLPECDAGLTPCDGQCVDLSSDWQHCGGCDVMCYEGSCSDGTCVMEVVCPPNLTGCFGDCVDIYSDPYNCGGCGNYCETGVCSGGGCAIGECFCGSLCEVISLGSQAPQSAYTTTDMLFDQWVSSCSSVNGVDVVYSFFAPQTATYWFDTFGSTVDAAIEVVPPDCSFLACGLPQGGGSVVPFEMVAGQQVLVIVDSQGQQGDIWLNISFDPPAGCATCNDVITTGDIGNGFCPGSEELYNNIANCICVEECAMACQTVCNGGDFIPECEQCIYDTSVGCGNDLQACFDDS